MQTLFALAPEDASTFETQARLAPDSFNPCEARMPALVFTLCSVVCVSVADDQIELAERFRSIESVFSHVRGRGELVYTSKSDSSKPEHCQVSFAVSGDSRKATVVPVSEVAGPDGRATEKVFCIAGDNPSFILHKVNGKYLLVM